jgi:hypothetical protein
MSYRIIDEMPSLGEVSTAEDYRVVQWHLYLRPTASNEELGIVKAIAGRYDRMSPTVREAHAARARREHAQ